MAVEPISIEVSGNGSSTTHVLQDGALTIGRSTDCDIVLDDERVSRNHASIESLDSGVFITDRGSSNGTVVNGADLEPRIRRPLRPGDSISIRPYTLTITSLKTVGPDSMQTVVESAPLPSSSRPSAPTAPPQRPPSAGPPSPPPCQELPLRLDPNRPVTLGRSQENDVRLDDPLASRRHARIRNDRGNFVIEDLGSSNGTFVETTYLSAGQSQRLVPGANIWIGNTHLLFTGTDLRRADESKSVRVDARGLNRLTSKGANLLQDIALSIQPQEFVVIVGPSGAGKSTLLGALSGLNQATSGTVTVNGTNLYDNFDALRTNIGYVPQDDIIHRELPVRASLEYAAQLRLPSDTSAEERSQRVSVVIQTLGLQERQDVPVGSLSGGQRKRVSIGVELLTSPGLFFLDEATSGLDPGTEAQMMRMLRGLADEGHTIVLVTHATKNVMLCDKVVFLAKGGYLAYYGPPEEALAYFEVEDFDGIYEKLDGESTPALWGDKFSRSKLYDAFVRDRLGPLEQSRSNAKTVTKTRSSRFGGQLGVLSKRYLDIMRRDKVNLALMLGIAPLLGAIDFLAWPSYILDPFEGELRRALTMLFLSSLIPFLVGAMTTIREIVKEGPIYRRERAAGLGVLPYVLSKTWVIGMLALYDAAIFTAIKIVALDWGDLGMINVIQSYGTVFFAVLSGCMWGLVLSAIVPREDRAMHLVAALIVFQMVFSGGLLPLGKLGAPGIVLGGVTSVNWALRGSTASLEMDTAECLGERVMECTLPGISRLETPPERLVVINTIEEDFGDVMGSNVYTTWVGMAAIIGVLFGAFVTLQKLKDRG